MAITSEEINYLVYRYLQESGVAQALRLHAAQLVVVCHAYLWVL